MSQLNCTFHFAPTDELRAIPARSLWSFGRELDDFFEEALALPGFDFVRTHQLRPTRLDIAYGEI